MRTVLSQWIGCQRVVYNGKVSEEKVFASQRRLLLASGEIDVKTPLDRCYSQFKDDALTPWLSEVPSQILRNGADRWMDAKQRQLKKLGCAPRIRNRSNFNSVLISSELFRFIDDVDADGVVTKRLQLGTEKNPVGFLDFNAHRDYGLPKQITVRRTGRHWWLSFSYEHAAPEGFVPRDDSELAYELNALDDIDLKAAALEQKILELKLQLDGVADKSDEWLAGYQNACLAVAVAYAAALIGPKKRSSSAFGHQNP